MKAPVVGIVVFPGSNCEGDVAEVLTGLGAQVSFIWHTESDLSELDAVILPGGFAHGDYLRPGAIARFSPVMSELVSRADRGLPVVGICNGFQVLTETGLLPGALQKNANLSFLCEEAVLEVASVDSPLTLGLTLGTTVSLPINHFEGNYTCDAATLEGLQEHERIILRYRSNPNGSMDSIAGICSAQRNVVGLMPHPERAANTITGKTDGISLFTSLLTTLR
ncbi:MAG: phosphoribosylformylglycinamidine synthase subunit PurQ [Acidimicrobiales bacterium]